MGFFHRMFGGHGDEHEAGAYAEAVQRGRTVVCVTTDETNEEGASDILNANGAEDIHSGADSRKQERESSYGSSTAPYSAGNVARETEMVNADAGDRSIPVVEEDLLVGKRAVQRGAVRVYNRVYEEPVEKQVNLREEHVKVERRAADRPATDADLRTRDEVIEFTEMAEEPVVEKRTRVVEEVLVGKEATNRTETVRDKVRRSEVEVERVDETEAVDTNSNLRSIRQ